MRSKGHIALSEDGKTLTMSFTGTRPDGNAFHEEDVFSRVSGTDGLIGTWRTAKVTEPSGPQTFVISSPAAGRPALRDSRHAGLGRRPLPTAPITRSPEQRVPPGMTISWKLLTPTKIRYVIKLERQARQRRRAGYGGRRGLLYGYQLECGP